MKRLVVPGAGVAGVIVVLLFPVGGTAVDGSRPHTQAEKMDLSAFSDAKPDRRLRLLFIHHSVGGALFASAGSVVAQQKCIWTSHPEGGNARVLLEAQGYDIHEASYQSELGEHTDLFDWPPKFRNQMDRVLHTNGQRNDVVVFKSCYPNNRLVAEGTPPGNPKGPELTFWNARAALTAVLPELEKHPDTLFVYLTVPPLASRVAKEPLWKYLTKKGLGKPTGGEQLAREGELARRLNEWTVAKDGWLENYSQKNVVVFDLFGSLTDGGASNHLRYPTGDGFDSHPARAGNEKVARELVPFINRAVRRAGLSR